MQNRKARMMFIVLLMFIIPASVFGNTLVITKVLDSDLVRIGDSFVARLTGITAPPKSEDLGKEIFEFTKSELEGKLVKIFTWTTDNTAAGIVRDGEGRAFVQIYYGKGLSISFNELLLKKSYARVDRERLPEDLKKRYLELEEKAREKGPGVW